MSNRVTLKWIVFECEVHGGFSTMDSPDHIDVRMTGTNRIVIEGICPHCYSPSGEIDLEDEVF